MDYFVKGIARLLLDDSHNNLLLGELKMSEILKRIKKANENNRRNMDHLIAEFDRKVVAEMNGTPMSVTRENDEYVMLKDGELKKVVSADKKKTVDPLEGMNLKLKLDLSPLRVIGPEIYSLDLISHMLDLDEQHGFVSFNKLAKLLGSSAQHAAALTPNFSQVLMSLLFESTTANNWQAFTAMSSIVASSEGIKLHWNATFPTAAIRREIRTQLANLT